MYIIMADIRESFKIPQGIELSDYLSDWEQAIAEAPHREEARKAQSKLDSARRQRTML